MKMERLLRTSCVLLIASAGTVFAAPKMRAQAAAATQPTPAKMPAYDIVSIKPDKSGSGHVSVHIDDGNLDASNVSLKMMILSAYGLKEAQIVDLPKWGDDAHFDIKAKVLDPDKKAIEALTPEQFSAMQQPILTDRFKLKFHRGVKTVPVYELVVVKSGPKFKQTTPEEEASPDGVNGVKAGGIEIHNRHLVATGVPLSSLADDLSGQLHRIVVDKTGLVGKYNFTLSWAPDDGSPQAPDATLPSLFTAVQEQLGLKLQSGKAEVSTFVVDSAALPDAD
jgi:uncharacterized protein (TIGR03435 family)